MRVTRVRHSPVAAGQVRTDKIGLRTSQEMGPNQQAHARHGCHGERETASLSGKGVLGHGREEGGGASGGRSGSERAFGALRALTLAFSYWHVFYFLYDDSLHKIYR